MGQLLPVGTIVKARWTEQNAVRMMIVGYYPKDKKTGKVYDYLATFYPMGMSFSDASQGLNQDAVLGVESMGFEDEDTRAYLDGLMQMVDAMKKKATEILKGSQTEGPNDTPGKEQSKSLDEWFV